MMKMLFVALATTGLLAITAYSVQASARKGASCLAQPIAAIGSTGRSILEAKELAKLEWSHTVARLHGESYAVWELSDERRFWRPVYQPTYRFVVSAKPCKASHIRED